MAQSNKQKKDAARRRRLARQKHEQKARQAGKQKQSKLEQLAQMNAQLQGAMFNLRQMYDQAVMEKEALKSQLAQRDQLITAASVSDNGITIEADDMALVLEGEVVGYNIDSGQEPGDDIDITPVWKTEVDDDDEDDESVTPTAEQVLAELDRLEEQDEIDAEEQEIIDALDEYEAGQDEDS